MSFPKNLSNPTSLFLLDFTGAIVSTFLLGVVLVQLNHLIGMPVDVLHILAGVAGIFMVYSGYCFFRTPKHWQPFLKVIAIANCIYCMVSLLMVYLFFNELTKLGVFYFLVEIAIVLTVVTIEWNAASK